MECKFGLIAIAFDDADGFNRYIVECKYYHSPERCGYKFDLIDT